MNIITTAKDFFQLITEPETMMGQAKHLFSDLKHLKLDDENQWQSFIKQALDQPRIPELIDRWKAPFAASKTLTESQATQFIQQLLGALESVDFLLDYRCTGSYTESIRDAWSDFPIYRPGVKQGWALHLTTEGNGRYNCLRSQLDVGVGDMVLLSPTAFFDYQRSETASQWGVLWLTFQADSRISELLNWREVGAGVHHLHCNEPQQLALFSQIINQIHQLNEEHEPWKIRIRYNLLEQLLLRCQSLLDATGVPAIDPRIQVAINFIEQHYTEDFCIDDVASAACLSASTLTRLFKKQTGLSVLRWRDEKRMNLACEMLTHSTLRIADIAEQIGYIDQLYFARCFRKHFQQSPTEYRDRFLLA